MGCGNRVFFGVTIFLSNASCTVDCRRRRQINLNHAEENREGGAFIVLTERAARGDAEAIAQLVSSTRLKLFALAYAELRHYDDAHDAVAAALVQICLHIHEVHQPDRVVEWMRTIVRNEVRQLRRRRQAQGDSLALEDADKPTSSFDSATILRLDIERALRRLPVNQERAIRLFYQSQLSSREIAHQLGASEGAVKMWLQRGRRHLEKDLEGYESRKTMKTHAPLQPTEKALPAVETAAILHSDLPSDLLHALTEGLKTSGYHVVTVFTPADLDPIPIAKRVIGWTNLLRGKTLLVLDERIGERSALEYLLNVKAEPEHRDLLTCVLYSVAPDAFAGAAYFSAGVDSLLDKTVFANDSANPVSPAIHLTSLERKRVKRPRHTVFFTPRLQRAVQLATQEATDRGEEFVGPSHLLLGLTSGVLNDGPDRPVFSGRVLSKLGVPAHVVRAEVNRRLETRAGKKQMAMPLPPAPSELSEEAKRVIDLSYEEAQALGDNFIGTEHLLLALVGQQESLPAKVAAGFGLSLQTLREVTQTLRGQDRESSAPA